MKKVVLFFAFCIVSGFAFSQDFEISVDFGIGNVMGKDFARGKYGVYLQPLYQLGDRYHVGMDLGIGNTLFPGDALIEDEESVRIESSDYRFIVFHLQQKYIWPGKKSDKYLGMGLGTTQLNIEINEPSVIPNDEFKTWNFSFGGEAGMRFEHCQIGLKYLYAGETPSFMGQSIDPLNREVTLEKETAQLLMMTFGYIIDFK